MAVSVSFDFEGNHFGGINYGYDFHGNDKEFYDFSYYGTLSVTKNGETEKFAILWQSPDVSPRGYKYFLEDFDLSEDGGCDPIVIDFYERNYDSFDGVYTKEEVDKVARFIEKISPGRKEYKKLEELYKDEIEEAREEN